MVDAMARRYGCLPTDILNLDLKDFNINQAIFLKTAIKEKEQMEERKKEIEKQKKEAKKSYNQPGSKTKKLNISGNNLSYGQFEIERRKVSKDENEGDE